MADATGKAVHSEPRPQRKTLVSVTALAILVLSACGANPFADSSEEENGSATGDEGGGDEASGAEAEDEDSEVDDEPTEESFTIVSVGDVLIHNAVFEAAATEDGSYDFAPLMEQAAPWISGADLALCSLEVPVKPEGGQPSGYPAFAAPPELITGLQETGFHGCNTATNHSLDSGMDGLVRTLDTFDEHGMGHVGTARDEEESAAAQFYTLERAGREVTVAHLSTTDLHNDPFYPPDDAPWSVTDGGPEDLNELAAAAREDGADIVVASVHWGDEYVHEPNPRQREYAEQVAAAGEVDLIFGNHSHTPQSIEQLDGGPEDSGMWVVWSMGNFISNQDEVCCAPETASGTMAFATVEVDQDSVAVADLQYSAVTVDREGHFSGEQSHHGIWPMADLVDTDVPEDVGLSEETIEARWDRLMEVMGEDALLTEVPEPTGDDPEVVPRR